MNAEDRVAKIQALLRKAESTSSEEEAQALFGKAQELMTKWAIDDELIRASTAAEDQEPIVERVVGLRKSYYKQDASLLHVIARVNHCRVLMTQMKLAERGMWGTYLIGHKGDVERVESLFNSVMTQMVSFLRQSARDHGITGAPQRIQHPWYRSFREGFTASVNARLKASQASAAEAAGANALPALRDRSARVDDWLSQNHIVRNGSSGRNRRTNGAATEAGYRAGERADLGQTRVGGSAGTLEG